MKRRDGLNPEKVEQAHLTRMILARTNFLPQKKPGDILGRHIL